MMRPVLFACAFLFFAPIAEADECSFKLVQSTLGEITNLYLEQQAANRAIDEAKGLEELLIVVPRGIAATAKRAADRHRLATVECTDDAANIADFVAGWLDGYERIYTGRADAGRRVLLGEIDFAKMKVILAENLASLDAHWKNLPQLVVGVSLATVGTDPIRPGGMALRLTQEQRRQLLSEIESDCSKLGGCAEAPKDGGTPAAVVAQRLMREHLRKPWALNGTSLK